MPIITNTQQTTTATLNREELAEAVTMTSPEETPIFSSLRKVKFKTINPNWGTVDLKAPAVNAKEEGRIYVYDTTRLPARFGTPTQILDKTGSISGSQEEHDEAGNVLKLKEQKLMAGLELKRDIELHIASNLPSVGGTTRQMGGLPSWATTCVSRNAGGANGGYNTGTKLTVAATNGTTQRAMTKILTDDVIELGKKNGVALKQVFLSTYAKRVFATFMSDANVAPFRTAAKTGMNASNVIMGDADIYQAPNGIIMVHENLVMSTTAAMARNVIFLDQRYVEFGWYRPIHENKDLASNADAEVFAIQAEGAVKPLTEKGIGILADIFGTTATT